VTGIPNRSQIAAALRWLRQRMGLSQKAAAERAAIHPNQLRRWESASTTPSLDSLFRYLAALERDLTDFQLALLPVAGSDSGSQARYITFLQALGTDAVQEHEAAPVAPVAPVARMPLTAPVAPVLPEPVAGRVLHLLRLLTALSRDPRSIELIDRLCRLERP
jgi:transcriptional regulator with XRE-family HTH domain